MGLPAGGAGGRGPVGAEIQRALSESMDGGPSAIRLAGGAALGQWPHYAAAAALVPVLLAVIATLASAWFASAGLTALFAAAALAWTFAQGFVAGVGGPPFGIGAAVALAALAVCLARSLGRVGLFAGNATIATIVVTIGLLLILFIFYPIGSALTSAVQDARGHFAPHLVG